jgi:hypothetical protein
LSLVKIGNVKDQSTHRTFVNKSKLNKTIMAIFSGEVTIKVKFKDIQIAVGYGMTSSIIKHRCVELK